VLATRLAAANATAPRDSVAAVSHRPRAPQQQLSEQGSRHGRSPRPPWPASGRLRARASPSRRAGGGARGVACPRRISSSRGGGAWPRSRRGRRRSGRRDPHTHLDPVGRGVGSPPRPATAGRTAAAGHRGQDSPRRSAPPHAPSPACTCDHGTSAPPPSGAARASHGE